MVEHGGDYGNLRWSMAPELVQAAEAFSGHDFDAAFPMLADDVEWDNVGGRQYAGRDAVIAACRESAEHLAEVKTTFHRSRTIDGGDHVVVDSLADYVDGDGESTTVGSCDIYAVAGGLITAIASYNAEVG